MAGNTFNKSRRSGLTAIPMVNAVGAATVSATPDSREPPLERLARLAQQCLDGQLAAAELELHAWRRQSDCPDDARALLAALLARRGELEHALEVLHAAGAQQPQAPAILVQMLTSVLAASELSDAAGRVAATLHDTHGDDPHIATWLRSMSLPGCEELPRITQAAVSQLAAELTEQPDVIPSLVAAQRIVPHGEQVELLRRAISRLLRQPVAAPQELSWCIAMAQLAMLADDPDDARRWAHRGLRIEPYCAPLALVLAEVADDEVIGPSASAVLSRSVERFPNYPDLRAAMIRRENREGRRHEARRHLDQWLRREPDHPVALGLRQELAA